MHDQDHDRRQEVALFRYGVIADLVHLAPGTPGLYQRLSDKADRTYAIPYSRRTRVAAETIRHWLKQYRKGGFDALLPKERKDAGRCRRIPQPVADWLLTRKEEAPQLSVPHLVAEAEQAGLFADRWRPAPSSVYRLLSHHGLGRRGLKRRGRAGKDRRRFAFARAGQLWMSDVMHGPAVPMDGRRKRKTYLIAFVDDATRVVPFAAFCPAENTVAFLPTLRQAIIRRGIPQRLYVDNGAVFRSRHLALVCARLGITLLHARPYDAAAKGKVERWFRTVRMQLLPVLGPDDTQSLEALNRRLWAWVETEYHRNPHRGLNGQCPFDRWAQHAETVRYPDRTMDLDDLFLFEVRRRVSNDRTISLNGTLYEVAPHLVRATVTVRHDPQAPAGRPVQIWLDGKRHDDATVVDAYQNCFVRRHVTDRQRLAPDGPPPAPAAGLPLRHLTADRTADKEER